MNAVAVAALASVLMVSACAPPPVTVSPSPVPTTSASPTNAVQTAPPTAASGFALREDPILGYRISLPVTYRPSRSMIFSGGDELGWDSYTLLTAAEERAECQRDSGDLPSPASAAYLYVHASRNVGGMTAAQWVNTPRSPGAQPLSTHQVVMPVTLDGREAVKLVAVATGETTSYVIRANDRMYLLTPTTWPSPHRLDDIAMTFQAIQPLPFPTPTAPSQAPRDAARQLGQALAAAFASRDANAIAGLMPECSIGVSAVVEPILPGGGGCCVLNPAVVPFIQRLGDRFASRELSVTVDPEVQVTVEGGAERFFVRSDWTEPGRTIRIDLFLGEVNGQWRWTGALHHYQRADNGTCVHYGSPWVPTSSSC
jgi:hypothetical protein